MTISGATRVACVIGDPVEHSRSPRMHNAASEALGLDRVYVALRVAPADLAAAVRGLRALGVDGANVTLPHKAGGGRAVRRARPRGARRRRRQHAQLSGRRAGFAAI